MPAVVRDPEVVTYALLDQASRRKLAGRQHGEGSGRRNSRAVISNRRAIVSKRQRGEGSGNRSSQADTSNPQTNVSEPAARDLKWELTSCKIKPPRGR